jgi:glutathione peroxidase
MIRIATAATLLFAASTFADDKSKATPKSALDFKVKDIDGKEVSLDKYKGKVVLIVNVASKCGLTPQYEGLQELYSKHKEEGLVVLGFPANEFKGQEPGTNEEIKEFCKSKYNVDFDMFSKIVVKGEGQAPLYKYLTTTAKPPGDIKWNFEKFLIGRDGKIKNRFAPPVKPNSPEVVKAIESELKKGKGKPAS